MSSSERNPSRREVLAAGASGLAMAVAAPAFADDAKVPTTVLGRTGVKVSKLGFGGSWDVDQGVLAAGVARGINYFDTAEGYGSGQSEREIGAFIQANCKRAAVYVVTKTHRHHQLEEALEGSLRRLRMDHVDTLYLHDIRQPEVLLADDVKMAGERLKKAGKIRFLGFSCHTQPVLPQSLENGATAGIFDVCMFRYSHRDRDSTELNRAIDMCAKAKMGLVAMKTIADPAGALAKYDLFAKAGLSKVQACIKAILADERMHAVVCEMVSIDQVMENTVAATKKLTASEDSLLRRYAALTDHVYCRGCEQLCAGAAGASVAVADILRYRAYHDQYGKRSRARQLFAALPAESRDLEAGDWHAGEAACPYRLPLRRLLNEAAERLG